MLSAEANRVNGEGEEGKGKGHVCVFGSLDAFLCPTNFIWQAHKYFCSS